MFWRMVRRTIFRQKKKMFMIAITIALGVSLSTAMINVMLGVSDKVNQELKVYGANITVMPKDASLLNDLYGLNSGAGVNDKFLYQEDVLKIKEIFWGFNIVDFAPYLKTKVELETAKNNQSTKVKVVGTWVQQTSNLNTGETVKTGMRNLRNWWHRTLKGKWLGQNDDNEVMVGQIIANKYKLKVGDTIKLKSKNLTKSLKVKSIFLDGGDADRTIITTLKTAQELANKKGLVDSIEVSALTTPDNELAKKASQNPESLNPTEYETWYCTAYASAICHQIQEVVRDGVAKPVRQVAESEGTILNKTSLLMMLITILSSLGSALAISNLITASVIERRQEIGLIKAIGGFDRSIITIVLTEIMLTGLVGGVVGYFAGLGFAQIIGQTVFGSSIPTSTMAIPIVSVVLFLVIVVGSIPAIRYLLNLKPTEVLHGK